MRPVKATVLLLALLALAGSGQTARDGAGKRGGDEQELRALVERECEAVLENQTQFLDDIWAEEMLLYTRMVRSSPSRRQGSTSNRAAAEHQRPLQIVDFGVQPRGKKVTV